MKRKIIALISLTLLLCGIFAYNVLASGGITNLYANGPSSFSYSETTNIDNYFGWPSLSVDNAIFVDGSMYDFWTVYSYNPYPTCNTNRSYNDPMLYGTNITARTYRTWCAPDRDADPWFTTSDSLGL